MNEHLPGMSRHELIAQMSPEEIVQYILDLSEKIGDIEREINIAVSVLEDEYGVNVRDALDGEIRE